MLEILAIVLLILGAALTGLGVAVYFLTDCREIISDLTTTRKLQMDSGIDSVAQDIYYSNLIAYSQEDEAEPAGRKRFARKKKNVAVDDTSLLAEKKAKKTEREENPAESQKYSDKSSSAPDATDVLGQILAATEPLREEEKEPAIRRSPAMTEPLRESKAYKKEKSSTMPLGSDRKTAPLSEET